MLFHSRIVFNVNFEAWESGNDVQICKIVGVSGDISPA